MLDIQERSDAVILSVRVQTRASTDEVAGEMAGALKVRLQAPPVENRANDALIEFLAQLLKTPKSAVRILSGDRSRTKRIEIRGVTPQQIQALLSKEAEPMSANIPGIQNDLRAAKLDGSLFYDFLGLYPIAHDISN